MVSIQRHNSYMTVHIQVSDELETQLRAEAESKGLSIEELASRLLEASARKGPVAKSGAELVAKWRADGLIGYRTDIPDSNAHSRAIRERAEKRIG